MSTNNLPSETFCVFPFRHLATRTDGDVRVCCRSGAIGSTNSSTLESIWNGEKVREIRRALISGERPKACEACWKHERLGVRSMRERTLQKWGGRVDELISGMGPDYTLPAKVRTIELKLSNLCNLRCRMCHPLDSSAWAKDWNVVASLIQRYNPELAEKVKRRRTNENPIVCDFNENPEFWHSLKELGGGFEVVEFAGGEPLIDPIHYRALETLSDFGSNIVLKYATNATRILGGSERLFEIWSRFKAVELSFSIDGIHDVYEYVRSNAKFSDLCDNIRLLKSHHKVREAIGFCTVQAYNISQLPEIFDYMVETLEIDPLISFVNAPSFLSCHVLPETHRQRIRTKLLHYRSRLADKSWSARMSRRVGLNIDDAIKFLSGKDLSDQWPVFLEYSLLLDESRGSKSLSELIPEYFSHSSGSESDSSAETFPGSGSSLAYESDLPS